MRQLELDCVRVGFDVSDVPVGSGEVTFETDDFISDSTE